MKVVNGVGECEGERRMRGSYSYDGRLKEGNDVLLRRCNKHYLCTLIDTQTHMNQEIRHFLAHEAGALELAVPGLHRADFSFNRNFIWHLGMEG